MPHIVIEHSPDISNSKEIATVLHHGLAEMETVNLAAVKTRTVEVENVIVGEAADAANFVHVTLKLLPGRDENLKVSMGRRMFQVVQEQLENKGLVTVEVVDLQTYVKEL